MAVRRSSAVAIAIAALVVAFAVAFLVARGAGSDAPQSSAEPVQALPAAPVLVNNLERAPSMKPLRHTAGGPPAAAGGSAP